MLLTASGPRFVCKDIRSGAVAARLVGKPRLRRRLPQTPDADGWSHALGDEPFAVRHPTARLPARSHAPGAPEDDVARGRGHRPQSRRLGVEVRIVLPDDRLGVHWVVVDKVSPELHAALSWSFPALRGVALDTCHLPMKYEAVASHHVSLRRLVSKFNVSFPSEVCPDVDALEPFRGERNLQITGDKVLINDHLCRASLPREQTDAAVTSMKSTEVWSGLVEWIRALAAVATLYPEEMKNKHFWKGKSRLRLWTAAATFQRYQ